MNLKGLFVSGFHWLRVEVIYFDAGSELAKTVGASLQWGETHRYSVKTLTQ